MILKGYQRRAIDDLEDFLKLLDVGNPFNEAFQKFWAARDVNAEEYRNMIAGVPQVCFKVPTGGGKTFMAAASLKIICEHVKLNRSKIIVWLVPSETILTQTYKNLNDSAHPYHQKLYEDFGYNVKIYNKEQLLAGENFSPAAIAEQLSILILSYDSFRATNKDGRKAYQQNGQLYSFSAQIEQEENLLPAADEISLINVIRHYRPIVIVDESHHAATSLSIEMLANFNPSFILELTATPKHTSNIISYVPAGELKKEGMVKLPVIAYNRPRREDVIADAIIFRAHLEEIACAEKIRPIVLFQAETQGRGERSTFDKIKTTLIDKYQIPAEQIAIKTAEINDLRGIDLMAAECPIRFIITVNALKEGWDCPFAYILASLANRNSAIDVEQILGRILRRPFTKNFSAELLNMSYVFTSSESFRDTLDKIVKGLNASGFSGNEYRAVEETALETGIVPENGTELATPVNMENNRATRETALGTGIALENGTELATLIDMENKARQYNDDYKKMSGMENIRSQEERERMTEFPLREQFRDAQEILLPRFFRREAGAEYEVSTENFRTGCTLHDKDAEINFDNLNYEIVSMDIHAGENLPRYKYFSAEQARAFLEHFDNLPTEGQIRQCAATLTARIDRNNLPSTQEIKAYVNKIVSTFERERLREAMIHPELYAEKIKQKIDSLLDEHARKDFMEKIDARKIFTKPTYRLPSVTTPTRYQSTWANSLYVAEEQVNDWENQIAAALTSFENVLWWHRNRSRKEFCLNGFINHYPDFIVRMKSGMILLIESKGDDRDNSDSKQKLELGKIWETQSGADKFGYFMVFKNNPLIGALSFDKFTDTMCSL